MKIISAVLVSLLCASCFEIVSAAVPQHETNALTELYNDAGGPDWTSNTNWLTGDPCENAWYGVSCNADNTTVAAM